MQLCSWLGGRDRDKLDCLVKDMKIKSLEETCLFSLPTRDSEIIEFFLSTSLKDEPLKTMPVQDRGWPSFLGFWGLQWSY